MAGAVIALQGKILAHLREHPGASFTAEEVAKAINAEDSVETVFMILEHTSANQDHNVQKMPAAPVFDSRYMINELS
jgi:aspartate aminotransferase-like enzyme